MSKGLLIVVSGPSGTGKGTVCKELLAQETTLAYSISATTRPMRTGEVDGREYYFRTREEFETMIARGEFLEYANVYDNYYGTPLKMIEDRRNRGEDILLEIDTQGTLQVMEKVKDGVFIFLVPPSMVELKRRIINRGSEDAVSLEKRMAAVKLEVNIGKKYDYVVMNDMVSDAVKRIRAILLAEKLRVDKNLELFDI